MADNFLYVPLLNPVKFYEVNRATTDAHQTPHFDDFPIAERILPWQTDADYIQPWQTTEIISLQFESTFDPITVQLLDVNGGTVLDLPADLKLPNKYISGTFAYEIAMSLASVTTGCYRLQLTCGSAGPDQKKFISPRMYISEEKIDGTVLVRYSNSRFHEDVLFETGIEFQLRIAGHIGFLKPGRSEERYKDQRLTPTLLSSRSFRQFECVLGDEFGLPDEMIDLVNRIASCDSLRIDNKAFGIAEGGQFEFTDAQDYPKRGIKLVLEEGINRASKIFSVSTDTIKKLMYVINVEAKVWGDLANSGSNNTVPIITVE